MTTTFTRGTFLWRVEECSLVLPPKPSPSFSIMCPSLFPSSFHSPLLLSSLFHPSFLSFPVNFHFLTSFRSFPFPKYLFLTKSLYKPLSVFSLPRMSCCLISLLKWFSSELSYYLFPRHFYRNNNGSGPKYCEGQ